jgi:hypothetical protein
MAWVGFASQRRAPAAADSMYPLRACRYISYSAAHLHVAYESAQFVEAMPV